MLLTWHLGMCAKRVMCFLEHCDQIEESRWRIISEACAMNDENEQKENWLSKLVLHYKLGTYADQCKVLINNFEIPHEGEDINNDNIRNGMFFALCELLMGDFEQPSYFLRKFRFEIA